MVFRTRAEKKKKKNLEHLIVPENKKVIKKKIKMDLLKQHWSQLKEFPMVKVELCYIQQHTQGIQFYMKR